MNHFFPMNLSDFKHRYQKQEVGVVSSDQLVAAPLVTICVQTYNHARFIEVCLDSILGQKTSFPIEILIGEDGSDDDTREICMSYSKQFPNKIKLFLHRPENKIRIDGRLTGRFNFIYNLLSARGKYIALCEGDDYWTDPLKLQKQVDLLEKDDSYSICSNRCKVLRENLESFQTENDSAFGNGDYKFDLNTFLDPYVMYTNSVLFRNQGFLDKLVDIKAFKDIYLFARLLTIGQGICLDEFMGVYRKHPGGQWSMQSENATLRENLRTATAMLLELNTPAFRHFFRQSFLRLYSNLNQQRGTTDAIILIMNHWKACRNTFSKRELIDLFIGNPIDQNTH